MIRTITVEVNAAYPEMPLERAAVYTGSAVSFTILNVPRHHGKRDITSVSVSLTNASGTITTKAATREGSAWNVTLPASAVGTPGSVTNGVIISASGTMEDGETAASWILAVGDLAVLNQDGTSSPDAPRQIVHVFPSVPTAPVFGDIAVVESVLKIRWNDGTWKDMGGGGSITLEDEVTQSSSNGVKSSGIWSFVKGLLPNWLTSSYAEPATVSSVSAKADKAVPAAANNFAALDASGNLVDSTKKAADFAAASHTHTKIVDGVKEISADLTAKVATGGYTDWNPSHTPIPENPQEGDSYYGNLSWEEVSSVGNGWICYGILYTDGEWHPMTPYLLSENPNATTLTFPDGTPTNRVPVTATKTIATTDQVPTVVSPSTASTDAGKAADAKATGDALAAKATPSDITSAISAHNAANDAHADIRATVGAKVASLSCGSGASQQTITPVNGVADVSPLFTSVDTSTDPTASGLLNNSTLDKGIVKVSNALIADACPYGVNVLSAQDLQLVDGCVNTINLNAADVHLVLPTMPIGKQADMLIEITVASGATVSGFSIVAPSGATMERIRMTDDVTLEAPTSGTTIYQFMYTSRRTDDGTGDPAYRVYSAQKKGEVVA